MIDWWFNGLLIDNWNIGHSLVIHLFIYLFIYIAWLIDLNIDWIIDYFNYNQVIMATIWQFGNWLIIHIVLSPRRLVNRLLTDKDILLLIDSMKNILVFRYNSQLEQDGSASYSLEVSCSSGQAAQLTVSGVKSGGLVLEKTLIRWDVDTGCSGKIIFFSQFTATPPSPTSL